MATYAEFSVSALFILLLLSGTSWGKPPDVPLTTRAFLPNPRVMDPREVMESGFDVVVNSTTSLPITPLQTGILPANVTTQISQEVVTTTSTLIAQISQVVTATSTLTVQISQVVTPIQIPTQVSILTPVASVVREATPIQNPPPVSTPTVASTRTGFVVPSICAAIGGLVVGSILVWMCLRVKRRGQRNVSGEASVPLPPPFSTTYSPPPDPFHAYGGSAPSTDTLKHTRSDSESELLKDQSEAPRSPNEMVRQSQIADTHSNPIPVAVGSRRCWSTRFQVQTNTATPHGFI